ncbi:hypothetical protein AGDE_13205 [Angomonas deanei]|uniref:Uncharacterized protein n=1 Tax=Angomonas deanei TaxID=59799 RepID=A0A7G2CPU6_9TRYP|nr:hypothetical protein AGDE_13205 [Angomonas deanei]CAD2221379.1 hypothetical protein, conserved [Angomonas deanei]|eukprot:EPY22549.1 hypothetical protein AGDE_13205 [Angomonas deanei]
MALEAILYYVSTVRQGAQISSAASPESISMVSGYMTATLFSVNENERYTETYNMPIQCAPETGFWAFAFISVLFIALFLFRYVWYRGRRHAKKRAKAAVQEDERRIMQGYGNVNVEENTAQPEEQVATQWMVDEYGNYYSVPAEGGTGNNEPAPAEEPQYQYWVDPTTGQTYQFLVEPQETEAEAEDDGAQYYQEGEENAEEAGDNNGYYVEGEYPEEEQQGEYAYDDAEAAAFDDQQPAGQVGEEEAAQYYQDPESGITYQVYVDPESGETYYQPLETDTA